MKSYNIPRKKWLYVIIAAAVIAAGAVMALAVGFGASRETRGGWALTTRISADFDFGTYPKAEVYDYLRSFGGGNAELREGEYEDSYYEIVSVYSDDPIETTVAEFEEAVEAKYAGLIVAEWTAVHQLMPSLTLNDIADPLIFTGVALVLAFAVMCAVSGLRNAVLLAAGIAVNLLLSVSLTVVARIPASSAIIAAAAVSAVFGAALCVLMLGNLKRLSKAGAKIDAAAVSGAVDSAVNGLGVFLLIFAAVIIGFAVLGAVFGVSAAWYWYTALTVIAFLTALYYPVFILPGFYLKRK